MCSVSETPRREKTDAKRLRDIHVLLDRIHGLKSELNIQGQREKVSEGGGGGK